MNENLGLLILNIFLYKCHYLYYGENQFNVEMIPQEESWEGDHILRTTEQKWIWMCIGWEWLHFYLCTEFSSQKTVWPHIEKSSIQFHARSWVWDTFVITEIKEELLEWLMFFIQCLYSGTDLQFPCCIIDVLGRQGPCVLQQLAQVVNMSETKLF
jgi:hypothetical protein